MTGGPLLPGSRRTARWTPERGALGLCQAHGQERAQQLLIDLLSTTETPGDEQRAVLIAISNGHARALLAGLPRTRLEHWPRVWAARALSYIGDDDAATHLLGALHNPHWRVRMMAVQALGKTGDEDAAEHIVGLLKDEYWRVRAAAAVSLGRIAGPDQIQALQRALFDGDERVQDAAGRALVRAGRRHIGQRGSRSGRVRSGGSPSRA
jgi:HEAT repeat protein